MMKKKLSVIVVLFVMISFALVATGCNAVVEEARWYFQNVKEKGLYSASLEFTENAVLIGGATALVAPEIGLILGVYAFEDASKASAKELILTVGNVAGFAAGTALILAPAAAVSVVGLATQGLPDDYEGGFFGELVDLLNGTGANKGASCHRDYDCVKSICDDGVCALALDANLCTNEHNSSLAPYNGHCLSYNSYDVNPENPFPAQKEPSCLLDIDCANGLCLDGKCSSDIACEKREDCPLSNHACINNKCLVYKECAIDQDCVDRQDGTNYCNARLECVKDIECRMSSECPHKGACYQDVCIECRFNAECDAGMMCFNSKCVAPEAVPAAAMAH